MDAERFQIRAIYDDQTIRVYQAYSPAIARAALQAGRFVSPFRITRMTWIKPSFYWMMYRCGFGAKEGQEVVLAIDITREGFEWALSHSAPSTYSPRCGSHEAWTRALADNPVRIQWDPERNWRLAPDPERRSIQIGLGGEAANHYVNEWTRRITDSTPDAAEARRHWENGVAGGPSPAGLERPYPLPQAVWNHLFPNPDADGS
jgi:hypothetical protein